MAEGAAGERRKLFYRPLNSLQAKHRASRIARCKRRPMFCGSSDAPAVPLASRPTGMCRTFRFAPCGIALLVMAAAQGCTPVSRGDDGAELLGNRRDLLCTVMPGMNEKQVQDILGPPDGIRGNERIGYMYEKYRWVYGTLSKGGFPRIGSVLFDTHALGFSVDCPSRPFHESLPLIRIPLSDKPQPDPFGVRCEISAPDKSSSNPRISMSLVNKGEKQFRYPHNHTGIRFSIVVEVYDANKTLILQEPLFGSNLVRWELPEGMRIVHW